MKRLPICHAFASLVVLTGAATAQGTKRVSLDSAGSQGDWGSWSPALSARGRFVAFYSEATNLVPGDGNWADDVFLHDVRFGTTIRVSVNSAGVEGHGESSYPAINANGRFVAFYSAAPNLVPGDTNGTDDVFVRDVWAGTTTRVSVDSTGAQGDGRSLYPAISSSGRYVTFSSVATNLVPSDTNGRSDVFVHDRALGTTARVSVDSAGAQGNGDSYYSDISYDGTRVVFESASSNLVAGDANGMTDVFVRDLTSGVTVCASVDPSGVPGNRGCTYFTISGDGTIVAFDSGSSNLVAGDTNERTDVFTRNLVTGVTKRASVSTSGVESNGLSQVHTPASLSFDGRFLVFKSTGSNLVPNDTNGDQDVFLHDRRLGTTTRVNVDPQGGQSDGWCSQPTISADGRRVGYYSFADDLVPGDSNGEPDVFVRRLW